MKGVFRYLIVLVVGFGLGAWWLGGANEAPPTQPALNYKLTEAPPPKPTPVPATVNITATPSVPEASPLPQTDEPAANTQNRDLGADRAEQVADFEERLSKAQNGNSHSEAATRQIWASAKQLEQSRDISMQAVSCDAKAHCMYKIWGDSVEDVIAARDAISKALAENGFGRASLGVNYDHPKSEGGAITMMVEDLRSQTPHQAMSFDEVLLTKSQAISAH